MDGNRELGSITLEPPQRNNFKESDLSIFRAMEAEQPWLLEGIEKDLSQPVISEWRKIGKGIHGLISRDRKYNAREIQENIRKIVEDPKFKSKVSAVADAFTKMPDGVLKDYVFNLFDTAAPNVFKGTPNPDFKPKVPLPQKIRTR